MLRLRRKHLIDAAIETGRRGERGFEEGAPSGLGMEGMLVVRAWREKGGSAAAAGAC